MRREAGNAENGQKNLSRNYTRWHGVQLLYRRRRVCYNANALHTVHGAFLSLPMSLYVNSYFCCLKLQDTFTAIYYFKLLFPRDVM